ncbi:helix-turn-helix domain-containing protein [Paenimyroides ummariense]|nr:helix-turn-helix domain-containing protein [Paenimyroides ummariense]
MFFVANSQSSLKFNEDNFTLSQLHDSLEHKNIASKEYLSFLTIYLQKAKQLNSNTHLFEAYNKLYGIAHSSKNIHAYADSLLSVSKELPKKYYIRALQSKATAFYFEKDYINSLAFELKILNTIDKAADSYSYYKSMYNIGLVYFHIQEYEKAYSHFNQARTYFEKESTYDHIQGYFNSLYREAFTLYYLKRIEESSGLINIGLSKQNLLKADDQKFNALYFNYILGLNLFQEKQFQKSIDLLKANVSTIAANDDFANEATIYYYIALNYWNLNNKEQAVVFFKKIDTIFKNHNYSNPEIKDAYTYLINHYREQNDVKEELHYTNQLLDVMKYLQIEYKQLAGTLHNTIDVKTLISDKERLENDLNNKSLYNRYFTIIGIGIALCLIIITIYNYRKRKEFLKNYNDLLKQREPLPIQESTDESYPIVSNSINPLAINIDEWGKYILPVVNDVKDTTPVDDKVLKELIKHLNAFEKNHLFLNKDITLNDLANQWNTNRTYLSQFINSYKEKSFIDYLNGLRITYFLDKVDTDKKWSKYKIQAIADQLGFSSARSFSSAFMKSTGMSPSFYLQQVNLEKDKEVVST